MPCLVSVVAEVVGLANIVGVAAGDAHSLALGEDQAVWGWGNNGQGQLGDGTTTTRYYGGGLGGNGQGQLGDGMFSPHLSPMELVAVADVAAVAAGAHHSVAVLSGGTVSAWGNNAHGELGDGTNDARSQPASVVGWANGRESPRAMPSPWP
jgi:alpha-tubulin suppressor-like RCC1 family protein